MSEIQAAADAWTRMVRAQPTVREVADALREVVYDDDLRRGLARLMTNWCGGAFRTR